MKKILVTGADGFIGSHLTEMLVRQGHKVKVLSQYNSFNHWGWLEDVDCLKEIEVLNGDVRDPHYCKSITKDVDLVSHLTTSIAIPYSYVAPDSYVDTNIKGTLNICQAALENNVSQVIHTSTSEVYGTAQYVPIDEKHPLQPQSPYSATKIAADAMAMSFHNAFDLPVTIASTAKIPHAWRYEHDEIGYNYRMPNLNAALGCAQLEQMPGFPERKRKLFERYRSAFEGVTGATLLEEPNGCRSNYWLQTLLLDEDMAILRDRVLQATNDADLMTRPAWTLMKQLKPFREAPAMDLVVARSLEQRAPITSSSKHSRQRSSQRKAPEKRLTN